MPQGKRWSRTRFTEKEEVSKSFYSQPTYMFEIGDREEGEPLLVNGVEVYREDEGVRDRAQLDLLVERAAQESPVMIPSVRELNVVSPDNDDDLHKKIMSERESRTDRTGTIVRFSLTLMASMSEPWKSPAFMEKST